MSQVDNRKPILMDRQSFADVTFSQAVAWMPNPSAALNEYTIMMSRYDSFIAAYTGLTPSEYDALPFICEEIKPYS